MRKLTLTVICLLLLSSLRSQTVIPPSSEAQRASSSNANINYYTGALNYTIPLFTIREGDIVVPISINYAGTGILIDEVPSWCGTGFTLMAGGTISRTVVGDR